MSLFFSELVICFKFINNDCFSYASLCSSRLLLITLLILTSGGLHPALQANQSHRWHWAGATSRAWRAFMNRIFWFSKDSPINICLISPMLLIWLIRLIISFFRLLCRMRRPSSKLQAMLPSRYDVVRGFSRLHSAHRFLLICLLNLHDCSWLMCVQSTTYYVHRLRFVCCDRPGPFCFFIINSTCRPPRDCLTSWLASSSKYETQAFAALFCLFESLNKHALLILGELHQPNFYYWPPRDYEALQFCYIIALNRSRITYKWYYDGFEIIKHNIRRLFLC